MAFGQYKITEMFERDLADYTGAPYVVAVDSCSNALFLSLMYNKGISDNHPSHITIPKRTFPSVPCEIIHAGYKLKFDSDSFKGIYQLKPFDIYDSALRFTNNMYIKNSYMCISFTGPRKRLKLMKGGAILTDNKEAVNWFKSARMSGRHEKPFMDDIIEFAGWNYYLLPDIAARGIASMREFYDDKGNPLSNEDVLVEYPDLSKMPAFK